MKKSFLSITMLVVSISMVVMFICGMKSLGADLGWYRVGPLARLQNCDFIPSPLAEIERQAFVAWGRGEPIHATLAYHWARMIELLHCIEVIAQLLDDPDILSAN